MHQDRLGLDDAEPGARRDAGRRAGVTLGRVVVAEREVDAGPGDEDGGTPPRLAGVVGQPRQQPVEGVEVGLLGRAVAEVVRHAFARDQRLEAGQVVVGELQRSPEQPAGLLERVHGGALLAGSQVPRPRARVVSLVEVLGDDGRELVLTTAARRGLGQPLAREAVIALPVRAQHAVVGHVTEQAVPEHELAGRGEDRVGVLEDQLAAAQLVVDAPDVDGAVVGEVRDGGVPVDPTDHRGALQDRALQRVERVEAGLEHTAQAVRHLDGPDQLGHDPPRGSPRTITPASTSQVTSSST